MVFLLSTIGVLLSTPPTARGSSFSPTALRTATPRPARPTCVRCGLFNYLSIYVFGFTSVETIGYSRQLLKCLNYSLPWQRERDLLSAATRPSASVHLIAVQNSPCKLATVIACTSSGSRSTPSGPTRFEAEQQSSTK